jgi:DNA-binding response OmpR family regulator
MSEKKIILVVDDVDHNRDMFEIFLEMEGYAVFFAENSRKVLPVIREIMPDLLLLDITMQSADGLQTLENLRKNKVLSDIPIIALTFQTAPEHIEKALQIGTDDYLKKPFDADELLLRVKKLIRLNTKNSDERQKSFKIQFKMGISGIENFLATV